MIERNAMQEILKKIWEQEVKDTPKWNWREALALAGISIMVVASVAILLITIGDLP